MSLHTLILKYKYEEFLLMMTASKDLHLYINRANDQGLTPLQLASREGHVAMVMHLLKQGAEINLGNAKPQPSLIGYRANAAKLPLDLARERGKGVVAQVLIIFDGKIADGSPPKIEIRQEVLDGVLYWAVTNKALNLLQKLEKFFPEPSSQPWIGQDPTAEMQNKSKDAKHQKEQVFSSRMLTSLLVWSALTNSWDIFDFLYQHNADWVAALEDLQARNFVQFKLAHQRLKDEHRNLFDNTEDEITHSQPAAISLENLTRRQKNIYHAAHNSDFERLKTVYNAEAAKQVLFTVFDQADFSSCSELLSFATNQPQLLVDAVIQQKWQLCIMLLFEGVDVYPAVRQIFKKYPKNVNNLIQIFHPKSLLQIIFRKEDLTLYDTFVEMGLEPISAVREQQLICHLTDETGVNSSKLSKIKGENLAAKLKSFEALTQEAAKQNNDSKDEEEEEDLLSLIRVVHYYARTYKLIAAENPYKTYLPTPVWQESFSYLDRGDLCRLSETSRFFRHAINDPGGYKLRYKNDLNDRIDQIKRFNLKLMDILDSKNRCSSNYEVWGQILSILTSAALTWIEIEFIAKPHNESRTESRNEMQKQLNATCRPLYPPDGCTFLDKKDILELCLTLCQELMEIDNLFVAIIIMILLTVAFGAVMGCVSVGTLCDRDTNNYFLNASISKIANAELMKECRRLFDEAGRAHLNPRTFTLQGVLNELQAMITQYDNEVLRVTAEKSAAPESKGDENHSPNQDEKDSLDEIVTVPGEGEGLGAPLLQPV